MSGRLIVVEGLDGAGKSTFIEGLAHRLDDPLVLREPGGTLFAEAVGQLVRGHCDHLPDPATARAKQLLADYHRQQDPDLAELFIFNAARADLVQSLLRPSLDQGRVVLLDRFYYSTIAYQGYGRGLDLTLVEDVCLSAVEGISPDRVFYLALPEEERLRRLSQRPLDKIEASGADFYRRVGQGFQQLAEANPQLWVSLDATLAPDALVEQALGCL